MNPIIQASKELDRQVTLLFLGFSFEEKKNDIRDAQEELRKCIREWEQLPQQQKSMTISTNNNGSITTTITDDITP